MGRVGITGLNGGNISFPQISLEQINYETKVKEISKQDLIRTLEQSEIKFTKEDIVFIKRDENEKIVWLETGNDYVGLNHIIKKHGNQFSKALNINKNQISSMLYDVISKENFVTEKVDYINGTKRINKYYKYDNNYFIFTGFGDNGFLVTSYPYKRKKGE